MSNTNFSIIERLMKKDGSLDSQIYDLQCEFKRDTTIDEENSIIQQMVDECLERCANLSCNITEAYNDIMH